MRRDLLVEEAGGQHSRPALAWLGRLRGRERQIGLHAGLWLVLFLFLLPIIWSISASFKGKEELFATLPGLLPSRPTLSRSQWRRVRKPASA